MTDPAWQLNDVSLISGGTARLSGIDLRIQSGVTAVLGASGAGKSSLLSLLAGFEKPTLGTIEVAAKGDAGQLPLFWSPQDHGLWPKLTAREHLVAVRPDAPQVGHSVEEWLALLRLEAVADALPHRLSQGERSRLSLGRSLASEAACLILDEPLAHIDPLHSHSYLDLLADHAKTPGGTVVFSTHDPSSVLRIAEQVVCLSENCCVFSGTVHDLYFKPPTEEVAWLLGPANWIEKHDADLRSLFEHDPPGCVRPGELSLTSVQPEMFADDGVSVGEVQEEESIGETAVVSVRDGGGRVHRLYSAGCAERIVAGARVRLRFVPHRDRATQECSGN